VIESERLPRGEVTNEGQRLKEALVILVEYERAPSRLAGFETALLDRFVNEGAVDSGAKRKRFKRSGFERLCQAL